MGGADSLINNTRKGAVGFTVSSLDGDATADVSFTDNASQHVTVHVTTNGGGSADLSSLTDGAVSVAITTTDVAANSAAGTGASLTLDTTAPSAVGTVTALSADSGSSNSDFITNVIAQTISGTYMGALGADEKIQVSANGGTTWVTATASSGTWSASGVTLSSGTGTLSVRTIDTAGNTRAGVGHSYILDSVAPTATVGISSISVDSGQSASDFITNDTTLTVFGTHGVLGTSETIQVSSDGGVTWANAGVTSLAWSYVDPNVHRINFIYQVRVIDSAGNIGKTASQAVTIDTTAGAAPGAPDLIDASDSGSSYTDNITNVQTPTFTGSGTEASATVRLYDTNSMTVLGATVADTHGNWTITTSTLGKGAHTLTAKQVDIAGNISAASTSLTVTIDTTPPSAPSVPDLIAASDSGASNTDNITKIAKPTFSGTAESGSIVKLYDGAAPTPIGTGTATSAGTWTITTTSDLSEGVNRITAIASDVAGNLSARSAALAVTIDTVVPGAPANLNLDAADDTGINSDHITKKSSGLTITGNGENGATATLFDDVNNNGIKDASEATLATKVVSAGNFTVDISLTPGTHHLRAFETDVAGNPSTVSSNLDIIVDTTAPLAPVITSLGTRSDGSATLSGTAEADSTVKLIDGAAQIGTTTADSSGNWILTTASHLANSVHTFTATATDIAGNTGPASTSAILGTTNGDTITGGNGANVIKGNGGNDKFVYKTVTDSTLASPDKIVDFVHNAGKIDFSAITLITDIQGPIGGSNKIAPHSVAWIENGSETDVLVNTTDTAEAQGSAQMEIISLGKNLGLTSTDFIHH